jgi:hypothetical protein
MHQHLAHLIGEAMLLVHMPSDGCVSCEATHQSACLSLLLKEVVPHAAITLAGTMSKLHWLQPLSDGLTGASGWQLTGLATDAICQLGLDGQCQCV